MVRVGAVVDSAAGAGDRPAMRRARSALLLRASRHNRWQRNANSHSAASIPTSANPAARHRRAVLMIVAAICWSTGGLLVRQLSITNAWEIVFWRSLFMSRVRRARAAAMHGRAMPRAVRAAACPDSSPGLLLAGTFFFFIGSLTRTTVANTFVLMSVSPFLAAIAARVVLNEPRARAHVARDAIAFAGIVVMFGGTADAGQLAGNLMALGVSVCFAAQLTVLRKFHATVDMLPMVMIAGLWSLVPAFAMLPGPFTATRARPRRACVHGLRPARRRLPARHRRVADAVGDRARPPCAARAHPRAALGVGAARRASGHATRSSAARSCCPRSSPTRRSRHGAGQARRGAEPLAGALGMMRVIEPDASAP